MAADGLVCQQEEQTLTVRVYLEILLRVTCLVLRGFLYGSKIWTLLMRLGITYERLLQQVLASLHGYSWQDCESNQRLQ